MARKVHPAMPGLVEAVKGGRLDRREFLALSTSLGLSAGAAFAAAGVTPLATARAQDLPRGGHLRIGMRIMEVTNPHAISWVQPANITMNVAQTLTRITQDNAVVPHLCQGWEASDDIRTWTFTLRPDATWANGRPFTADDVLWNIDHVVAPETGSSAVGLIGSYLLNEVETGETDEDGNPVTSMVLWDANAVEKVDDLTVRFNLKAPTVTLPEDLFFFPLIMLDPEEGGAFGAGSNGTGPFTLEEVAVGERAVLRSRPDYWGGAPPLDLLEYIDLGDDPSAWIAAVVSGQVHGLYQLDAQFLPVIDDMAGLIVHEAQTAATAVVQMKVPEPPFDDPRVRLAMRVAMDSDRVVDLAVQGRGLAGEHHFVCPIHPEYYPLAKMDRDPERARELLAEAGHPDGIDITMIAKADPPWELAAVQVMAEQYAEAGIRMQINNVPSATFWDNWDKAPLGFVEWVHRPGGLTVLNLGFRSGVPWNAPEWSNAEFDALLDRAAATLDLEERREVFREIQIVMQEDGPIAQPVWRAISTVFADTVEGYVMHPQYFFFGEEMALTA